MTYTVDSFLPENKLRSMLAEAYAMTLDDAMAEDVVVISQFYELLKTNGAYQFFTKASLGMITTTIATSLPIRHFVLSGYERFVMLAQALDGPGDWNEYWLDSATRAVGFARQTYNNPQTLLPDPVADALGLDTEMIEQALYDNPWLLALYQAFVLGALASALSLFISRKEAA